MHFQGNFLCEPPKLGLILPISVVATMMDMLWNDDGSFGHASHKPEEKYECDDNVLISMTKH